MKNRLTSLNGAITLSAIAWLTELWRAWLDMLFEYNSGFVQAKIDGGSTVVLTTIYTVVFVGWAYSMHAATRGSQGALVASFVFNTFTWLAVPVAWMTSYCTGDCQARAGILFNTTNWLNLVFGLLAVFALAFQLRRKVVLT